MLLIVGTMRLPADNLAAAHLAEWRAAWPALGIGDRDLMLYDTATSRLI